MTSHAKRETARKAGHVRNSSGDPFILFLSTYSFNLARMKELQKTFKSQEEDLELDQRTQLWEEQLERLVKIVPTTWFGLRALVNVCLDPESMTEDDPLLYEAMKTISQALRRLLLTIEHRPSRG